MSEHKCHSCTFYFGKPCRSNYKPCKECGTVEELGNGEGAVWSPRTNGYPNWVSGEEPQEEEKA